MKLHIIACEIFTRELSAAIAKSPNRISVDFLPFKLHQQGGKAMASELQKAIDSAPTSCDAIALAFCLCNNGLLGLEAKRVPLAAFRSHDCIACLLGNRETFQKEHESVPGSYWLSPGWLELGGDASDQLASLPSEPAPDDPRWLELVEKYGDDNAAFLWEEQRKALSHYERLVYIDTGLGPQDSLREEASRRAQALGLRFELRSGSTAWIEALADGQWDDARFVVAQPGQRFAPRYDGSIVAAESN